MQLRLQWFNYIAEVHKLVFPGVRRNDNLALSVVRNHIRNIAAGEPRDDLLHQRRKWDQTVIDPVAALLLILGDHRPERSVLFRDEALGPPCVHGRGRGVGDEGPRQGSGCAKAEGTANHSTPAWVAHYIILPGLRYLPDPQSGRRRSGIHVLTGRRRAQVRCRDLSRSIDLRGWR